MLKKFTSLSLIYSILLLSIFSSQISAQQIQPNAARDEAVRAGTLKTEQPAAKLNVKQLFANESEILKSDTSVKTIDFKKLENLERKKAAKSKISKSDKTWIVVFFVALAVGVTLLAIYGKVPKCSDLSCNPDYDTDCICDR